MQAAIQTPTNRLEDSIDFYEKLGFKKIEAGDQHVYTDGKVVVEINPDRYARAGIRLYQSSWTSEIDWLKGITQVHRFDNGYLLSDASGVWIYLMEAEPAWQYTPEANSFSALGNYAGMSLETTDMNRSAAIYEAIGFKTTQGSAESGFVSYDNNGFGLVLMKPFMCPHLFFNPSLTYFNSGKNLEVIEKIRALQIPITQEITHFNKEGIADNIIIRDPGGYGFFIFND